MPENIDISKYRKKTLPNNTFLRKLVRFYLVLMGAIDDMLSINQRVGFEHCFPYLRLTAHR